MPRLAPSGTRTLAQGASGLDGRGEELVEAFEPLGRAAFHAAMDHPVPILDGLADGVDVIRSGATLWNTPRNPLAVPRAGRIGQGQECTVELRLPGSRSPT